MAPDLDTYLDEIVYPALFERLNESFPEFRWKRRGKHWVAKCWPRDFPDPARERRPDRLMVYANRPWWIKVHGHQGVRFLAYVNGGRKPDGAAFVEAVRTLCARAGVPFPEQPLTPEAAALLRDRELRRAALDTVIALVQNVLWSPRGKAARSYLAARGFSKEDIRDLGFGLYPGRADIRQALATAGCDLAIAEKSGVLRKKMRGYITIPWADANGQPLTIYGRWPAEAARDGLPKTIALPGEGTKGSPLYFDRARRARHKDLVAVEGVLDAALLQRRGDTRVVAYVAAQFSGLQVETLARCRVRSVTICADPDDGGDRGTLSSIRSLRAHGISVYVAPRLPDGLDPDEFVLEHGIDVWKERVGRAVAAAIHEAGLILEGVTPESPDSVRRESVASILDLLDTLQGPTADLDREDVLRLTEERTGYPYETVRQVDGRRRADREAHGAGKEKAARSAGHPQNGSAPPRDEEAAESKLRFRTAAEIAAETPAQVDWAAKPWVAFGALTEIAGKVKAAGKTTFVSYVVRAVLDGLPFMGERTTKTPVVWLTEQSDASFREALRRADLLDRDDLVVLSWHDTIGISWPAVVAAAVAEAEGLGARLIVVDTLPQFAGLHGDSENNSGDALQALRALQVAAAARGIAIVIVRHDRKGGGEVGDSGRGSSAFGGAVDIVLSLRRPEGAARPTLRSLRTLSRFDETPPELVVELTPEGYVPLGIEADVAKQEARARILAEAPREKAKGKTLPELVKLVDGKRTTVQEVVKELRGEDLLARTGKGKKKDPYRFYRPVDAAETNSAGTHSQRAAEGNGAAPPDEDPEIVAGVP
jgi:DNA primase